MISDKATLATRVGWIRQEINQQLENAKSDLQVYTEHFDDVERLKKCQQEISTIQKILYLAGVHGGEQLADEIGKVLIALTDESIQDRDVALEVVAQGFIQLGEYLQHIQEGYADLPVVILPLLNELRAVRNAELLSDILVFIPEDVVVDNSLIGTDEYHRLSPEMLEKACTRLRFHFQRALLAWYKGIKTDVALQNIQKITTNLIKISQPMSLRILWWTTSALVQALQSNKLEHGVAIKLLIGNIEKQIPQIGAMSHEEGGEEEGEDVNTIIDLQKTVLYYIGLAEKGASLSDQVKEAYMLDVYLPQGDSLERMRQHYASSGRQLWRSVADSVDDDIETIMEGFKTLELNPDDGILQLLIEKNRRIAVTLGMIGLGKLSAIIDEQSDTLIDLKENPKKYSDEDRMDIASTWLKLKGVLDHYAETGMDITPQVYGDHVDHELCQNKAKKGVYKTILEELTQALDGINSFEKEGTQEALDLTLNSLNTIKGTMNFLGNVELVPFVEGALSYIDKELRSDGVQPKANELAKLADVLTVLESAVYLLKNDDDHTDILETGYKNLEELNQLSSLHDGLQDEIVQAREEAEQIKKQKRQSRMQTMLAI
jgi:hypothetical protein